MTKRIRRNLAEQISDKGHGSAPYQTKESIDLKNTSINRVADEGSIQLMAYEIYQAKGGTDLDNWLEAERILSCS